MIICIVLVPLFGYQGFHIIIPGGVRGRGVLAPVLALVLLLVVAFSRLCDFRSFPFL